MAFTIGILPEQLYGMELWEFSACLRAYNRRRQEEGKQQLEICWQTANFAGAAVWGKLRKLNTYLKDNQKATAPKVSREEFDRRLKLAEEGGAADGPERA